MTRVSYFSKVGLSLVGVVCTMLVAPMAEAGSIFGASYTFPKAGQYELTLGYADLTSKVTYSTGSVKGDGNDYSVSLSYAYSEAFSTYLNQEYVDTKWTTTVDATSTSSDTKTQGIGATEAGVKGLLDAAAVKAFYMVGYSSGLFGKSKEDTTTGVTNGAPISPAIRGSFGLSGNLGFLELGGIYDIYNFQAGTHEIKTSSGTSTYEYDSYTSNQYSIFLEAGMIWNFGLMYSKYDIPEHKGTISGTGTKFTVTKSGSKSYSIYADGPVATNVMLSLRVGKTDPDDPATGTTYNTYFGNFLVSLYF